MPEQGHLYLIRHGETAWNRERRLQGGRDSALTPQGRRQAEAVAIGLRKAPPASILASPLGRASKTALIIARTLDIPVVEDERLGELRFGDAEGLTLDQIDARWPGFREKREVDKWHVRWPNGESYFDADARIAGFVQEVIDPRRERQDAGTLAFVGHETINMILLGRLLELDAPMVTRLGQPNHVIYRLKDGFVDHAHLGDDHLDWVPGLLQKRSDEILHVAA